MHALHLLVLVSCIFSSNLIIFFQQNRALTDRPVDNDEEIELLMHPKLVYNYMVRIFHLIYIFHKLLL
jgi:hypothetical protein